MRVCDIIAQYKELCIYEERLKSNILYGASHDEDFKDSDIMELADILKKKKSIETMQEIIDNKEM